MPFEKGEIPEGATPFEKGQSGNPNGRPKGVPNSKTRLQKFLSMEMLAKNPVTKETEKYSVAEIMDMQQIAKAIKGDGAAWDRIQDRTEGKPAQTTIHEGGENAIKQVSIFELPDNGRDDKSNLNENVTE